MSLLRWLSLSLELLPLCVFAKEAAGNPPPKDGAYVAVERMDSKRLMMRVPAGSPLPPVDEEVMLDELEHWKWTVEMSAENAVILVSASFCPHGLGLLPSALGWQGGGRWRGWPGTFAYLKGSLESQPSGWHAINEKKSCEGDAGGVKLGEAMDISDLSQCQKACVGRSGCVAVDFYRKTKWCNMYSKACTNPTKEHDGASSWKLAPSTEDQIIKSGNFSFLAAKQACQEVPDCQGFSYSGTWPDNEREGGIPRIVHFSASADIHAMGGPVKWHSYLRRENPRANCNPEGRQFECPDNPYACLGLSIDAAESSIKQAYRSLSKRLHPDKVRASARSPKVMKEAEAAFRDIAEAHETLVDPQRRHGVDRKMKKAKQQWEADRASVQDIYIKEPWVISLEPEMYPVLLPKGQEWLVHFFLPDNDGCKSMKMAFQRAATELGIGEDERGVPTTRPRKAEASFKAGGIYRGTLRERSTSLRNAGAVAQEGDTHIAIVVLDSGRVRVHIADDVAEVEVNVQDGKQQRFSLMAQDRVFTGSFDSNPEWFRGSVALATAPKDDVASFAMKLDLWQAHPTPSKDASAGRRMPRLFGAVNCGRFADFCKRKGADPKVAKRFPQVRMLFPAETRFEVFPGRPLGKELVAFAREASRPTGTVLKLNAESISKLKNAESSASAQPWLILLRYEVSTKAALDCELCRTALPMLQRTANRLSGAGVNSAWVNCTSDDSFCAEAGFSMEESKADWGSLRMIWFGGSSGSTALQSRSHKFWDSGLFMSEVGQQGYLSALEAASRMAEFLGKRPSQVDKHGEL